MLELQTTVPNVLQEKLKTQIKMVNVFVKTVLMKMKMVHANLVVTNVSHVHLKTFVHLVLVLEKTTQLPMNLNVNVHMVIMKTQQP